MGESAIAVQWISDNYLRANATKFQTMFLGMNTTDVPLNIQGVQINSTPRVLLLGVETDNI